MLLAVTAPYLRIPTDNAAPAVKLRFFADGIQFDELDIRLAGESAPQFATRPVEGMLNRTIEIRSDVPDEALSVIRCSNEAPCAADDPCRPRIHFTAPYGWINDPNGLVWADGTWHLCYQWNPVDTEWGNMHWGHACSTDLFSWQHLPVALKPDAYGTMFSGSGWQDHANAAGFGHDALLCFYTAAGGTNRWSQDAGAPFTQRLAVSADGGLTLEPACEVLGHVKAENRDPKILWHEASGSYIMVLYLDADEFAIYRSPDLLHWTESQRLTCQGMNECPDLFELPVENCPGETRWVFWSADSTCMVGDFDGYTFTPCQQPARAYANDLAYAAQTYAGTADRKITVAWLRTQRKDGGWRGMMAIPAEMKLMKRDGIYGIAFAPVRELGDRVLHTKHEAPKGKPLTVDPAGEPILLRIRAAEGAACTLTAGGKAIEIGTGSPWTVILDHGIIEYYGDNGLIWGAVEAD